MGNHRFNPHAHGNVVGMLPPVLKDRYGRPIDKGALVIVPHINAPTMKVVEVVPNLDPGAPPNTLKVIMQMVSIVMVPSSTPIQQFIQVRTAAELAEVEAAQGGGLVGPPVAGVPAPESTAPIEPTDLPATEDQPIPATEPSGD